MYQLSFDLDSFLAKYWHKQPTVIKHGITNFIDPISPEELAGLAMEEEVDSRFVTNKDDHWQAQHGPLPESLFSQLEESHWQLIVQACNHWHPGAAELVAPFKALPQWLFDDLMVCYSAPQGGVGPHIDQYDVFIIQGSGKRRWQVGAADEGQYQESIQGALRQIESFDAIIDEVLEPGDILYIPPGFPHEGNTIESSMSYSMGFRSPKEQELLSHFADYVLAKEKGDVHLHNPQMQTQRNHGEILRSDLTLLTQMLQSALESKQDIENFLALNLSQSRHQLDIVEPEEVISQEQVCAHLEALGHVVKVSGLRALYHANNANHIFINGEEFSVAEPAFAPILCDQASITLDSYSIESPSWLALLTRLVNLGYWYLD
ncbi:50S ribosomal protein L16 arginine hydroxylase [Vibrio variabilis]|uniref:50S ribosomal protein L16 arginine hydroxylase n=1 Tax=Vibrio variabilis TaxID=990271 RepID=A0ABR4YAF0_9VIBR|nr:cupin domain-containing protein [Vibrio variabilis]KHA60454.1 50S ribosomal protein L16 arginine hydroxylase [Vibrio variabilis]